MTESEAKGKWCPMVRFDGTNATSVFNESGGLDDHRNGNCIGSGCMMWREYALGANPIEWHGYCGLARFEGPSR